jgi:hypothetical protein
MRGVIVMMAVAGTLFAAAPIGPAQAQWVFVARRALGRIEQMQQSGQAGQLGSAVAAVVLDAPAARVYAKAASLARRNPAIQVLADDAVNRRLEFAESNEHVTLSVQDLSGSVSQLMVLGPAGAGSATSRTVAAVLRVCKEMNKTCTLGR